MPEYRRCYIPGGTYFFTLVTCGRIPFLCTPTARQLLREKLQSCQERWPFQISAIVLLPEHLHTVWSLPGGEQNYSARWGWIKKEFTKSWLAAGGTEQRITTSKIAHRNRGVWQARFWEHTIRDENDLARHFDYIHYNPVKHGLARCPRDWPYSSFHRWVAEGVYPVNWGCANDGPFRFDDLEETAME